MGKQWKTAQVFGPLDPHEKMLLTSNWPSSSHVAIWGVNQQ